ncbi:glycosyltransferase [Acidithiobacillus sp. HP-11]|uniref:glycosyltransferase n=1 Tax=Acidithiobacillus sp. HP-11 TaxID=2697656 RepID=UPI00187AF7B4|nr:glycosyltransferase [Acidithiobacillus sp. HP-11]MBE7565877.1 glycosyltransferase [Acidithiobacillus sp. HP-11]
MTIQHINELFALDGRLFVTEAYRILLKREPDEGGINYYLGRLARGYSKAAVIAQLAKSTECRPVDEIDGLKELIANEGRAQHWFWGLFGQRLRLERNLQIGINRLETLDAGILYIGHRLETMENVFLCQTQEMDSLVQQAQQMIGFLSRSQEVANSQSLKIKHSNENDVFLGRSNLRYVFNLTTSHHWRAHPVGIIRVERELAKYLLRYKNVIYVIWDGEFGVLRKLDDWQVVNILSEQWCDSNNKLLSRYHHASLSSLDVSAVDTFVSVGLDWDLSPVHEIAKHLNKYGTKMVFGCHDTVPIIFPEFTVRSGMDQLFRRHFVDMAHTASFVWTNSEISSRDLINFWIDAEIETYFPKIKAIPLGAADKPSELPQLSEVDVNILQHTLSFGDYVLYVSSLEPRKNHRLLVNIWRELYRTRGLDCPRLIFVGMRGWGIDDLLNQIGRMAAFKCDKITWLENVSDSLLSHLYAHSMFTVFPSMYEGWGLAVTEALSYGKICVVADNSALPKASQGLMPKYQPHDYFGWLSEISRLIDDNQYRSGLEQKISENYVARNWEDFSREFCEQILSDI